MASNPRQLAQAIKKEVEPFDYDPFIYDYDEDEDVDYDVDGEDHLPSEYDPWYEDKEDPFDDTLTFLPTKKKGIIYLMSNFMGDGFTTPENVARYIKGVTPYNRQEWEKERGNR